MAPHTNAQDGLLRYDLSMQLVLDDLERFAPVTLRPAPMTDEEFLGFCSEHEDLEMEINSRGEIEIVPLASTASSHWNTKICTQLDIWAERDASWISHQRLATVDTSRELWNVTLCEPETSLTSVPVGG